MMKICLMMENRFGGRCTYNVLYMTLWKDLSHRWLPPPPRTTAKAEELPSERCPHSCYKSVIQRVFQYLANKTLLALNTLFYYTIHVLQYIILT